MNKIFFVGSKALSRFCPTISQIDTDIICDIESMERYIESIDKKVISHYPTNSGKKFITFFSDKSILETELIWPNSVIKEFTEIIEEDENSMIDNLKDIQLIFPSIDALYSLKMSHRYLKNSPHFIKTMRDIRSMRGLGANVSEKYKEWLVKREKETYHYKHPKLDSMSKDNFFIKNDSFYQYDHDDIHCAIALDKTPAYRNYMVDDAEVQCDRNNFFDLPESTRINGVLEEALVLALERIQIPNNYSVDKDKSFLFALEKVCTSITSGWFREYAWEHYDDVVKEYYSLATNYIDKFKIALNEGEVKPFNRVT